MMFRRGNASRFIGGCSIVILIVLLLSKIWRPVLAAQESDYYIIVDTLTDHAADYDKYACTDAPNDCSLRGSIRFSNATDTGSEIYITIPTGTYYLMQSGSAEDFNLTGDLDIRERTVHIHGTGQTQTILDGQTLDRVIDNHGTLFIDNLKITQGKAPAGNYGGGAIRNYFSSTLFAYRILIENNTVEGTYPTDHGGGISNQGILVLEDSSIVGNTACAGGGIESNNAELTIVNSYIAENVARTDTEMCGQGGGIGTKPLSSQLTMTGSEVFGNTAKRGAGIYFEGVSAEVTDSYIHHNVTSSSGAGIECIGSLLLTGTTLYGNSGATVGGGIIIDGPLTAQNVTFYNNSASYGGGGLFIGSDSVAVIDHATFYGNTAPEYGAALWASGCYSLALHNIIAASDDPGNTCTLVSVTVFNNQGYNLSSDHSCRFSVDMHDLIDSDPQLTALGDYGGPTPTMGLLIGSPAIDAGDPVLTLNRDQRSYFRPVDGDLVAGAVSDIGAYEYLSFPLSLLNYLPMLLKPMTY